MQISERTVGVVAALTFAVIAYMQTPAQAQQASPQPLQVTSPGQRGESQGAAQAQTASGELLSVDDKARTLSIKTSGNEMTFKFDDSTKISGAQKGAAGLATMTGAEVTIQYRKDGASNLATNISVSPAKASPAPEPSPDSKPSPEEKPSPSPEPKN